MVSATFPIKTLENIHYTMPPPPRKTLENIHYTMPPPRPPLCPPPPPPPPRLSLSLSHDQSIERSIEICIYIIYKQNNEAALCLRHEENGHIVFTLLFSFMMEIPIHSVLFDLRIIYFDFAQTQSLPFLTRIIILH